MANNFSVVESIKFAYTKFNGAQLLKWAFIYAIITSIGQIPSLFVGETTQVSGALIAILGLFAILAIVFTIVAFFYVMPRAIRNAMKVNGIKVPEKYPGYIDWLILQIRLLIVNLICIYDMKLLLPAVVLFVLIILLVVISLLTGNMIFSIIAAMAIMPTLFAYFVAVLIHTIRTSFAPVLFLRGDGPEGDMPKKSHEYIKGKTGKVFWAGLSFGIVTIILILVVSAIASIIIGIIPLVGNFLSFAYGIVLTTGIVAISMTYNVKLFKFYCPKSTITKTVPKKIKG